MQTDLENHLEASIFAHVLGQVWQADQIAGQAEGQRREGRRDHPNVCVSCFLMTCAVPTPIKAS